MRLQKLGSAIVVTGLLVATAHAVPQTFFGEDRGLGDHSGKLLAHPNADAAQALFLAQLVGVGTEDFEGLAHGATQPLALVFPGAGTATLMGSGEVQDDHFGPATQGSIPEADREFFGRFAISGDKYFGQVVATGFSVTLSDPVAAFGFYGSDIGDFSGTLSLALVNGGVVNVPIPNTPNLPGGSVIYFGYIDAGNPFTSVTFNATGGGGDAFGFDDLTIGSVQQVVNAVPEPATAVLGMLGLAGLGLGALRRRA